MSRGLVLAIDTSLGPVSAALLAADGRVMGHRRVGDAAGQQAEVAPWLRAFDLFALPSYANEGVPQALMQAMFSGLACVTTDAGAIGEVALPGQTAVVVPREDPVALGQALAGLLADPVWRQALGERARTHVLTRFTRERMLDDMLSVFGAVARP